MNIIHMRTDQVTQTSAAIRRTVNQLSDACDLLRDCINRLSNI